jgi:hypothetical protein
VGSLPIGRRECLELLEDAALVEVEVRRGHLAVPALPHACVATPDTVAARWDVTLPGRPLAATSAHLP